jgi:WD40 repeat protein
MVNRATEIGRITYPEYMSTPTPTQVGVTNCQVIAVPTEIDLITDHNRTRSQIHHRQSLASERASRGIVNIWDVSGERPALEPRHRCRQTEGVREPAFSADGRFLATAAQGASARLWDLASPNPCASPRLLLHGNVVPGRDQSRFALGCDRGFRSEGKVMGSRRF